MERRANKRRWKRTSMDNGDNKVYVTYISLRLFQAISSHLGLSLYGLFLSTFSPPFGSELYHTE